ncbi:LPS export ABC transporter periplasmic protein LptC [Hymenobacter profundi]|uniref:LPS export ABC transporter periplasmic protein LptC n=1 Tax=Hymenobacter profundi TaxID=1982110 RepID=UPI001C579727|nr:LPS export ABC transporter periplasmic protein LptC [Hymenobacter profundi]
MREFRIWIGLGLALIGCQKQEADPTKKVMYEGPMMETTNVLTFVSDSAKLQVKLTAPLQQQFESGDVVYPKSVKLLFYSKNGQTVVNTITGDYGKQEKSKGLYSLRGHVRVKNEPKQQTLQTEELFYDQQRLLIYTKPEMYVHIETPTDTVDGYGLEADQNFTTYKLKKVTGKFSNVTETTTP